MPTGVITVEALIVSTSSYGSTHQYVVAGSGTPDRAYYLIKSEGDFKLAAGNTGYADGQARRDVLSNYDPWHWYYVATTFKNDGSNTVVNSYVADLTAGQTTLAKTLDNETITGNFGTSSSNLGIGMFSGSGQRGLQRSGRRGGHLRPRCSTGPHCRHTSTPCSRRRRGRPHRSTGRSSPTMHGSERLTR